MSCSINGCGFGSTKKRTKKMMKRFFGSFNQTSAQVVEKGLNDVADGKSSYMGQNVLDERGNGGFVSYGRRRRSKSRKISKRRHRKSRRISRR